MLTHISLDILAAISQTMFSNIFSWRRMLEFRLISLKFVPKGPINSITTLVQIMAWRRPGDKPLSEPIMVRLPTHLCVTRPQWVYVMSSTWFLFGINIPHDDNTLRIRNHYDDVIMGTIASQITSLAIVYSIVYSSADQRKHQSTASLAFVWGFHRGPVNSPHKWPVMRKCFHLMTSSC